MLEPRRDLVVADKELDQIFGVEICGAFHQRRGRDQKEKRPALHCRLTIDRVPWDVVERPPLPRFRPGPPAGRGGWGDQVAERCGRVERHGVAFSEAAASLRTVASSKGLPPSWKAS